MSRESEIALMCSQYPAAVQMRYFRIGKELHRQGLIEPCRVGLMAGDTDRRSDIIAAARQLRRVGMISGLEFFLIRLGLMLLYRLIERILFGDDT